MKSFRNKPVWPVMSLSVAPLSLPSERQILIADAVTDADLKEIGVFARQYGMLKCLAGCAGFASILPEVLDLTQANTPSRGAPLPADCWFAAVSIRIP